MRTILVSGLLDPNEFEKIFQRIASEIDFQESYKRGDMVVSLIGASKYYFRASGMIGIMVCSTYDGKSQRIDIATVGGGGGALGVKMGAGDKFEKELMLEIKDKLDKEDLPYKLLSESST